MRHHLGADVLADCEMDTSHRNAMYATRGFVEHGDVRQSDVCSAHHVTRHNTPIHNTLSTASQLSISHKLLETLPEDGNVMPKHVEASIHN